MGRGWFYIFLVALMILQYNAKILFIAVNASLGWLIMLVA
jgi:hypothetical protein